VSLEHGLDVYWSDFSNEFLFLNYYQPLVISPNEVILGWTEALQLMKEGAKWKLYIPPELGYGERGAGGVIPGGAVLVFTLTLLEVLDSEAEL
jgi:FKBP-type peptidyl-prolyl cis-trans isomerase